MKLQTTLSQNANFESDLKPFIIEQLNHTASEFYYDIDRYNKLASQHGLPPRPDTPKNVIIGKNQKPGICQDYAAHFIENFRGAGDLFYVSVDGNGITKLFRRIKRFEKSDISVPRHMNHFVDGFYNAVMERHRDFVKTENKWGWSFGQSVQGGLVGDCIIGPYIFNSNTDGTLYLLSEAIIPTKQSHAGKTDIREYSNHAWVRIIWNGLTIDVEPTWYDTGQLLEFGVIEIVTGKAITYPSVSSIYRGLPNTSLISPYKNPLCVGLEYRIVIASTDFTEFAIVHDDQWHYLSRNKNNPRFGIIFTVPRKATKIMLCGIIVNGNRKEAKGLVSFDVEIRL
jgi:hypothetical protein